MDSTKYIAFLRGINVGGNKKVPMTDLKKLLESLGFTNVKTLLNSGNVSFEAPEKDIKVLTERIEQELEKNFGFSIKTILRTGDQIKQLIDSEPFKKIKLTDQIRLYVTFLPDQELFNVVDLSSQSTIDLMTDLDKKYGQNMTTRNWNTVLKMI